PVRQYWASQQWTVVGFLFITTFIEISNWFVLRRLEEFTALPRVPRVSVLVPARNEERSIVQCVTSLLAQDYPNFDVLVLDDGSTDGTRGLLNQIAAGDARLHVLDGQPLPSGWLGKHWACQQLLEHTDGEYVLYVDADTWHDPAAVHNGVSAMLAGDLDLLSAIPHEVTGTFGEMLTVPMTAWSFFALLPMWLAFHTKMPLLASAIGQYMMFRTSSLKEIGGFERVRSNVIDDLALARLVKASGMRWRVVDGTARSSCRMYHGLRECVQGFSKNLYAVFYHNPFLLTFVWLFVLMVYSAPAAVLVAAALGYSFRLHGIVNALGAIALSILQWGIIAVRFHFSWTLSLTWVLGQPLCVFIAFRSMMKSLTRRTTWKDRVISSSQRPRNG
ncbi:MAG: glycosyltransferase, partial [Candidatus Cryosericum sp.]